MKRRRILTVTVGAIVGVLGLVLVTVGLVGLAQAAAKVKPRFTILTKDPDWVLDSTTALQWQKAPGSEPLTWETASTFCPSLGGGSRLPEVKELISLVDYSKFDPALPEGHPFQIVPPGFVYWSATTNAELSTFAWVVNFSNGNVSNIDKAGTQHVWCVR